MFQRVVMSDEKHIRVDDLPTALVEEDRATARHAKEVDQNSSDDEKNDAQDKADEGKDEEKKGSFGDYWVSICQPSPLSLVFANIADY